MNLETFFQSKQFKWILGSIGALIVLLAVFQAGIFVGTRKADFSFRWGENYHRVFGGPGGGFLQNFSGKDFISGHGTAGIVIKMNADSLVVKGSDNVEKTINLGKNTTIRKGMADIKITNIAVNDRVVIIGAPRTDGTIDAELIRVFDAAGEPLPPLPQQGPQGGFQMRMPMFQ
ncbi:hypothetical protein D4R52_00040 [bacterium]|nr:MAG: hypothetical protein D4R52_00040 [bacterium]